MIGANDALIAQAEAAGEIEATRQGAKVTGGLGGRTGEALVVVGTELVEHGIGLLQSGGRARRSSLTTPSAVFVTHYRAAFLYTE